MWMKKLRPFAFLFLAITCALAAGNTSQTPRTKSKLKTSAWNWYACAVPLHKTSATHCIAIGELSREYPGLALEIADEINAAMQAHKLGTQDMPWFLGCGGTHATGRSAVFISAQSIKDVRDLKKFSPKDSCASAGSAGTLVDLISIVGQNDYDIWYFVSAARSRAKACAAGKWGQPTPADTADDGPPSSNPPDTRPTDDTPDPTKISDNTDKKDDGTGTDGSGATSTDTSSGTEADNSGGNSGKDAYDHYNEGGIEFDPLNVKSQPTSEKVKLAIGKIWAAITPDKGWKDEKGTAPPAGPGVRGYCNPEVQSCADACGPLAATAGLGDMLQDSDYDGCYKKGKTSTPNPEQSDACYEARAGRNRPTVALVSKLHNDWCTMKGGIMESGPNPQCKFNARIPKQRTVADVCKDPRAMCSPDNSPTPPRTGFMFFKNGGIQPKPYDPIEYFGMLKRVP